MRPTIAFPFRPIQYLWGNFYLILRGVFLDFLDLSVTSATGFVFIAFRLSICVYGVARTPIFVISALAYSHSWFRRGSLCTMWMLGPGSFYVDEFPHEHKNLYTRRETGYQRCLDSFPAYQYLSWSSSRLVSMSLDIT